MKKVVSAIQLQSKFALQLTEQISLVLNVLCMQGLLVLSLALGEVITGDVKEIPTSLPAELRDFLSK